MSKAKGSDVKIVKGQEAEEIVLNYLRKMNRPYGAVDVCANLKGAVPKTATQKILLSLAERGDLVQKVYGKTSFFVANQANIDSIPPESLVALESEYTQVEEENKLRSAEVKALTAELNRLRSSPTDSELERQTADTNVVVDQKIARLELLRSGTTLVSSDALAELDGDWLRWKAEWVRRKKVFTTLWHLATDAVSPQDAAALADELGIEHDSAEHGALQHGALWDGRGSVKRKR